MGCCFKKKITLCKYHEEGYCRKGGNCSFAHGKEELKTSAYFRTKECKNGNILFY
jgi:hypothetical protein